MSKEFRVMVVDDAPQDIHMLFEELRHEYQVVAATSASEAFKQLEEAQRPHVILLDVNMPNMDGYQACLKIKENPEYNDIDIIFTIILRE